MEMIIVLLFFSIAAAVILRSFAASDSLARESRRMESMAFCAQSAAEIFSKTASISETANTLFGGSFPVFDSENISEITIPMTSECKYSAASPELFMTLREASEDHNAGRLARLEISFTNSSGENVYELETGAYVPERTVSGIE